MAESGRDVSTSCGETTKRDGVEIHQIENVGDIDILKINKERIIPIGSGQSRDDKVLLAVDQGKVVDKQPVLAVDDVSRLDVPNCVANQYHRGMDADMGGALPLIVLEELRLSLHSPLKSCGCVVVKGQQRVESVAGRFCAQA